MPFNKELFKEDIIKTLNGVKVIITNRIILTIFTLIFIPYIIGKIYLFIFRPQHAHCIPNCDFSKTWVIVCLP